MSHYSIGDVHGCFDALMVLLKKIHFNSSHDTLWFTGDLVNRGPASLEVLRFIKHLPNVVTVLGNHDLHLLAIAAGKATLKSTDTLSEVLDAPDCDELCHWLRQQPLLHHDAYLGYTLVHAGFAPQWNLTQALQYAKELETVLRSDNYSAFFSNMYSDYPRQWNDSLQGWERLRMISNYFTRLRFCKEDSTLDFQARGDANNPPKGYKPWFKIPHRASRSINILFGHWAALNGKSNNEPHIYPLDTGCVWGNCLTALRLEDGQRFSTSCYRRNN